MRTVQCLTAITVDTFVVAPTQAVLRVLLRPRQPRDVHRPVSEPYRPHR